MLSSIETEGQNITDVFLSSCESVALGELVHCPTFTLFEAMSSIELMDSKMDSGLLSKKVNRPSVMTWDDVELVSLPKSTIVHIFDLIMESLVTFLEGSSLAQTVFTCLYLHDPGKIQDPTLKTLCFGSLRLLDKFFEVLNLAAVFEEEDIYLMTYGFSFASHISEKTLLAQLKTESDKCQQLKSFDGDQLSLRISFLHSFIVCCNAILGSQNSSFATSPNQTSNDVKKLPQIIEKMLDKLKTFKELEHFAGRSEEFSKCGFSKILGFDSNLNQHLLPPTFPKAAAFPSWSEMQDYFSVTLCSFKEGCILYSNASNNCCTLSSLTHFLSALSNSKNSNLLERSIVQCILFSNPPTSTNSSQPSSSGGLALEWEGKTSILGMTMEAFIAKTISASVSHLPFTSDFDDVTKLAQQFLAAAARPVFMLIKCYGKNRSRLREHLIRVNQELFALESPCVALDNALNAHFAQLKVDKSPVSHRVYSWLSLQASNVMQQFVFLGFELELYSDHELLYIFWYLADFLLIWACSLQKERLEKFSDELLSQPKDYFSVPSSERPFFKMQRRSQSDSSNLNQKKNKQQQKQLKMKEIEMATQSALLYEVQAQNLKYLQSLLSLFCGYYKSLILLKAADKLPVVVEKCFDNEKLRFERRFSPIALEADCFPSYDLYCAAVLNHASVATAQPLMVLTQAAESFSDAKKLLTDIRGLSSVPADAELMFKISSNNLIVLNLVHKQWASTDDVTDVQLKDKVKFKVEFQPHYSNWPIFKLEPK